MDRVQPNNPSRPRRGFSFVEVMFAVVILGIGFIMVAAIFPVAISQNQVTGEAASASAFARLSASVLQQVGAYNSTLFTGYALSPTQATTGTPNPTYVLPFDSTVANTATTAYPHGSFYAAAGSLISSADPRFAVVPLYSWSANSTVAQFYFFNVTVRNQPVYSASADATAYLTTTASGVSYLSATLTPKLVRAIMKPGTPSTIIFTDDTTGTTAASWNVPNPPRYTLGGAQAVGTGCYVLVGNDGLTGTLTGSYNGKVFKVGAQRLDLDNTGNTWELAFGGEFNPTNAAITQLTADVWLVGKGLQDHRNNYSATGTPNAYTDAVQDVSFYTTYAPVQ